VGTGGISDVSSIVGYSFLDGLAKSNSAFIIVLLKSFEERSDPSLSVDALIAKVRDEFATISEANIVAFNLPPIIGLGTGSGFEYQLQDLEGSSR
jgi:multidrug efflux pump subunit AcrB